jgi:hypothetical protein
LADIWSAAEIPYPAVVRPIRPFVELPAAVGNMAITNRYRSSFFEFVELW